MILKKIKRTAPKNEIIKKLSKILEADLTTLFDRAGASKKTIAPDIEEYIKNNPEIKN